MSVDVKRWIPRSAAGRLYLYSVVLTLAGFMLTRLGHIPRTGESVEYENRRLTVVEMEGRRIAKIQVEPIQKPEGVGETAKRSG